MAFDRFTEPAWAPQPCDEGTVAYGAFSAYLAGGPKRTISEAAASAGVSRRQAEIWAVDASWDERAALYDAHLAATVRRAEAETVSTLQSLRYRVAETSLTLSAEELQKHLAYSRRTPDITTTTVRDALRLGRDGSILAERLERGATETAPVAGDPERAAHLSDDELAEALDLTSFFG